MTMEAETHSQHSEALALSAMPQQRHVRRDGDDWTGVTISAERRRLQNRLNQRAYRHRKQRKAQRKETVSALIGLLSMAENEANTSIETPQYGHIMLVSAESRQKVLDFARAAMESFSLRAPRPTQLQRLIKLNALNAYARNAALLGYPTESLCEDETISFFSQQGPRDSKALPVLEHFLPTSAQRSLPHHPWLDLIPFPVIRDRAIRAIATGLLDEDELCLDLMEVDDGQAAPPTIIAWGDSSNPNDWEATMPFLEKYGWLVWGSSDILNATNAWRAKRGEKQIPW